jgi:hypothetical protein
MVTLNPNKATTAELMMSQQAKEVLDGCSIRPADTRDVVVRHHYFDGDLKAWKERLAKAKGGEIVSFTQMEIVEGPGNGWSLSVATEEKPFTPSPGKRQFATVTAADRKATRIILQTEYEAERRSGKMTETHVVDQVHNLHRSMAPVAERSRIGAIEAVIQGY